MTPSSGTMKKADRNALIAFPIVVLIGAGIAVAGSQGGAKVGGVPVFALCVALAFVIQWLAFVPAYLLQSERFYDLPAASPTSQSPSSRWRSVPRPIPGRVAPWPWS